MVGSVASRRPIIDSVSSNRGGTRIDSAHSNLCEPNYLGRQITPSQALVCVEAQLLYECHWHVSQIHDLCCDRAHQSAYNASMTVAAHDDPVAGHLIS